MAAVTTRTGRAAPSFAMAMILAMAASDAAAAASLAPSQLSSVVARTHPRQGSCHDGNRSSSILSQVLDVRGGSGEGSSVPDAYDYGSQQQQQPSPSQMMMGGQDLQSAPTAVQPPASGGYDMNQMGGSATNDPMYEYRETVEDRIDAWRKQQQQMQQSQSAEEAASAIDDQGRFKLFTTVSRVSVSFFFFILMWRTVHHYELADATFGRGRGNSGVGFRAAVVRTIVVTPLVVLFLGEMMGAILGLSGGGMGAASTASHATKKRLKGILNLHKAVELVMICYNIFRLAVWPSKYVMREVYIGRIISNFFFLMQAQLYTKLSWDDVSKSTIGEGGYATESYYDDYTPDMAATYENTWQSPVEDAAEYYNEQAGPLSQQQQQQQQQQTQQYQQSYDENGGDWNQ